MKTILVTGAAGYIGRHVVKMHWTEDIVSLRQTLRSRDWTKERSSAMCRFSAVIGIFFVSWEARMFAFTLHGEMVSAIIPRHT